MEITPFSDVLARVSELETLVASTVPQPVQPAPSFASVLSAVQTPSGAGESTVAAAASQLGAAEQPPGSNDGPQIATYRSAVAGAQVGEITSWAQATGRYLPAGSTPEPGDLILFGDQHVGIVESVNPDGSLTTIEGNYDNQVSQVHRMPGEATGYVRPSAGSGSVL